MEVSLEKVEISVSPDVRLRRYHYVFSCIACNAEMELITGSGRYGNLGEFCCPYCAKRFYATIDDCAKPRCHIFDPEERLAWINDLESV